MVGITEYYGLFPLPTSTEVGYWQPICHVRRMDHRLGTRIDMMIQEYSVVLRRR